MDNETLRPCITAADLNRAAQKAQKIKAEYEAALREYLVLLALAQRQN